jgi:hypothetical protein
MPLPVEPMLFLFDALKRDLAIIIVTGENIDDCEAQIRTFTNIVDDKTTRWLLDEAKNVE